MSLGPTYNVAKATMLYPSTPDSLGVIVLMWLYGASLGSILTGTFPRAKLSGSLAQKAKFD